jgi:hypothetical protein
MEDLDLACRRMKEMNGMTKKNPHWGTTLDEFLGAEGIREAAKAEAPLTKSFSDLVQNRAADDPEFAAALREAADTPPLTMREALRQIWEADRYPILGNEDARVAMRMSAEALARAGEAVPASDDPPEFAAWIAALLNPQLPKGERDDIISAIYDLFDPDRD